ncbi:Ubiquinone/menaquinone biosynthesis C-methyltransferase UbiE [Metallosphaera sp. J1]|uniref:class I SAM-dependent methyltransferase n=1 Tax=Metallosphaera TaxID=41980 RepID=UPI001EDFC901|nr:class I SAM-dependent methyltransferase [Metallosphaera javensis (ex Hofmann et al. 2022)]MCG3108598.1 Ubiquinone/menaquinone biosynthesis C-methyltransferase UbiE [Metallosphaera javensis (ex Hofmann et al. 2022)]BCS91713.1 MAG: ubiquinone/menaquinone biosynthesis C-methyltransferase UbiE [Metallosphaera javensis (ex Sakai et al. 2022)]
MAFVCPVDRLPLSNDLKCPKGHAYRVVDGIYDFLQQEPKSNDILEKVAPLYEDVWAPLGFLITGKATYSSVLRDVASHSSGREFLDVGTGPGKIFEYVKCENCYGLDISLKFLRILKERRPRVIAVRGDAVSLPFGDESFDGVTSMFVIHMFPDPSKPVSEISRVLKRNGKCTMGVLTRRGRIAELLSKWWKLELRPESFYVGISERFELKTSSIRQMGPWSLINCVKTSG